MRVVGYYNSFSNTDILEQLNLKALTHVNYAFLLPRSNGQVYFINKENAKKVISVCHSRGIKVFVSVGGWCNEKDKPLYPIFEKICTDYEIIQCFVDNIASVVEEYGFDGVDLDWEYPTYEKKSVFEFLILRLSTKLHNMRKEFSIAIYHSVDGEARYDRIIAISDYAISNLDFVNVMTYDCHDEKNHSSINLAKKCVNYWVNFRKIRKEKILIGIPFYAKPSLTPYSTLVYKNNKNADNDFCGEDSYNGRNLVRKKVKFAKANCGGVFIWAINYDTTDSYSLLSTINDAKR
ncbi:MAG: glycoside hydrolase family 18 protein [Clostridia bacterium]|nr:glycoside hydrolase family 18 protein [Clostridia bacterium]